MENNNNNNKFIKNAETNYITATIKNIKDIIDLRMMYLIEYNKKLEKEVINQLEDYMNTYLTKHLNKDCFIELAYKNDTVISIAILNIIEKVPSPKFPNGLFGELYGVYTHPLYRNQGIATNVVTRIINNNKNKRLSFIQLGASKMGAHIYKKIGFVYTNSEYEEMKYYF